MIILIIIINSDNSIDYESNESDNESIDYESNDNDIQIIIIII